MFNARKYTESFEVYEQLFQNEKVYSPAMLLKMAYIKEGLNDYTSALYYLTVYFNQTLDAKALTKINELASEHELAGYGSPEGSLISGLLKKYGSNMQLGFTILIALLLGGVLYINRNSRIPAVAIVVIVIIAGIMLVLNNYDSVKPTAIIASGQTYLMESPSASSDVSHIIGKGHKVEVLETGEIWTKIMWDQEEYFVRSNKILPII